MQSKLQELEAKVQWLERRIEALENTNRMPNTFAWPQPVEGVVMGIAQAVTAQIQPDNNWPYPQGARP